MSESDKRQGCGCGCANIPISLILLFAGGGFWWLRQNGLPNIDLNRINELLAKVPGIEISLPVDPLPSSTNPVTLPTPTPTLPPANNTTASPPKLPPTAPPAVAKPETDSSLAKTEWEKKAIRGIYLSRYQITNNTSERVIRDRVKYYKKQGFNTIVHGVFGNACTMYQSEVMQQTFGLASCPNLFRDRWLEWLIDEAHKQDMEVHAYFEKGIKIDKNSPIFDRAIAQNWVIPGIDRTYVGVEHYLLDVEHPIVANFFREMLTEFVQKYPQIDAVQWDDYLGYHAELPGEVDRTASLTEFARVMIKSMKQVNPNVSFDICHHNPYWAKRYFAADWKNWGVDRIFIQNYNEKNFRAEFSYINQYGGIAITDRQFHRLPSILANKAIDNIFIFPLSGKPEETASQVKNLTEAKN